MVNVYRCVYHVELNGRQDQGFGVRVDNVAAASGDAVTLAAKLTAAGMGAPPGRVLVFDSIANAGLGTFLS